LSDPQEPGSAQPFHAAPGKVRTHAGQIRRQTEIVVRRTRRSVLALLRSQQILGNRPRAMVLVVGSTIDPERIANPHIRAHAEEGRLFRSALEGEARRQGIRTAVVRERDLLPTAAAALGISPAALRRALAGLGRQVGAPWGANEKAAAAAAWMALAVGARPTNPRKR
jgi:hypothetical protein